MIDLHPVRAFLKPRHLELAKGLGRYAASEFAEHAHQDDDDLARRYAREICASLGRGGWLKAVARQDFRACCVTRETLAFYSPLADAMFALQALVRPRSRWPATRGSGGCGSTARSGVEPWRLSR